MKINPFTPVVKSATSTNQAPSEAKTKAADAPVTSELGSTGVRKALEESTGVDMDKVRQVRDAIAKGELSLDPHVLAEAVVSTHRK
jgi:negative regulator of flagellin synthesis FlgM